jgi:hypothetical protein
MPERVRQPEGPAFEAALAEELRAIMARKQISQAEIGREYGWKQPFLSKRLAGRIPWDTLDLVKVCDYLDVDMGAVVAVAKQRALDSDDDKRAS